VKWGSDFYRRVYDETGARNPRWDGLVHAAFDLWGLRPEGIWKPSDFAMRMQAWKRAVDAGCKDAIVTELYLVSCSYVKMPENSRDLVWDTADRLQKSACPALCKEDACVFATRIVRSIPGDAREDRAMRKQLFDLAMDQWQAAIDTPGVTDAQLGDLASELLANAKFLEFTDERANQLIVMPMVKRDRAVGDYYQGVYLMGVAFDRRGYGYASTVTPARMQAAEQYASEAGQYLKKAWLEDPSNPGPAIHMIQVEMLVPTGRAAMEKWYQRAIAADPNSVEARGQKLTYLLPQWFGSFDEMIALGRECLATHNWDGRIPEILVSVHRIIAQQTGAGGKYFADPIVWKDVQDVYDGMIKHDPKDAAAHNGYAYLAAISGHRDVAQRELAIVGDKPDLSLFGSVKNYEDLRRACGLPEIPIAGKLAPSNGVTAPR
jgi:hypothetical protein